MSSYSSSASTFIEHVVSNVFSPSLTVQKMVYSPVSENTALVNRPVSFEKTTESLSHDHTDTISLERQSSVISARILTGM